MKRLLIFALLAAAAVAIGLSLFELVWFRKETAFLGIEVRFLGANTKPFQTSIDGAYIWISVVCAMAAVYYLIRITATAITVLIGVSYSRLVQWRSPRSAYLQGAGVLACAVAMLFVTPELVVAYRETVISGLVRDWGGYVLIGAVVLSLGTMYLISRMPELAAIQGWVVAAEPAVEESDEPVRRERPLVRPAPLSIAAVDANPFRAGPQVNLDAKIVKTARAPEPVKVVQEPGADRDKPKLLG